MKKKGTRLAVLASVGPYAAETLLLVVLPLLYVCLMSIMTRPSYGGVEFTVSFNGYRALFEKAYLVAIWNSVRMSLVSTVIILLVSYPMAYMLSRCSRRVASNLIILMMIPYFTNSLIRLYSYITLFNTKGILTGILTRLGMTWSADFLYSESAVVLGLVYVCIPYAVLPMYSSIERLDKALLEASYDLGAGRVKTFFRITLPMTMPGVYAAAIISFVPSIGNYFVADVLGGSKTLLIGNLIKDQFMSSRNWPLGSALSVFLIAGTMILVYLYARVSRADVMEGGPMNRVKKKSIGDKLGVIYAVLLFAFIYIPTVIVVVYSFNQQPSNKWWTGFTAEWYGKLFRDAQLWQSFSLSLKISLLSTLIVVIIGTLGAMGLTRYRFFGRNALTYSVYLPMIVPGVVFAVPLMALLVLMGLKKGFWAVVLGNVILMLPYMILTVRTRFLGLDRSVEEASMDLGASGVETFFRITLPSIVPGIFTGALLSFALTLDDVVMADFLAGPNCLTFPMKIYNSIRKGVSPEINALETIISGLIFLGVAVYLLLKGRQDRAAAKIEPFHQTQTEN